MILELDIGNSRIKWRLLDALEQRLDGGSLGSRGRHHEVLPALSELLPEVVAMVRVACVREREFCEALALMLRERYGCEPGFASVAAAGAGLNNGYESPEQMGVDRWLSMLAARARYDGACCVVDAGSALTVDIIDEAGQHQGGYILPGLQMMLESMQGRSNALQYGDIAEPANSRPGLNTRDAMEHGVLLMILGLLEKLTARYPAADWYMTGGDAPLLARHIAWEVNVVPELVLDGLRLTL